MSQPSICQDCGALFTNRPDLFSHREMMHHIQTFKCPLCGYKQESWNSIEGHIRDKHSKRKMHQGQGPARKRKAVESQWQGPIRNSIPELLQRKHSSAGANVTQPINSAPVTSPNQPPQEQPPQEQPTQTQPAQPQPPNSPASTISFINSPQVHIPILKDISNIMTKIDQDIQADLPEPTRNISTSTQVTTKTIITTTTFPDGRITTTTETHLYPKETREQCPNRGRIHTISLYTHSQEQENSKGKEGEERKKEGEKEQENG